MAPDARAATRAALESRSGHLLLWRIRFLTGSDGEPPTESDFELMEREFRYVMSEQAAHKDRGAHRLVWTERHPPREDHVMVACEFVRSGEATTEPAWAVSVAGLGDLIELLALAGLSRHDIWLADLASSRGEHVGMGANEEASRFAFVRVLRETKLEDWEYCPACRGTGEQPQESNPAMMDWCRRCRWVGRVLRAREPEDGARRAARRA